MRICDLKDEDIVIGLRIKSLNPDHPELVGTIVKIEHKGSETFNLIQWDGDSEPRSGFYWNDCECEVMGL